MRNITLNTISEAIEDLKNGAEIGRASCRERV